jgi:hypothetical protein
VPAALRQFLDEAWDLIDAAVCDRAHPCRILQLATVDDAQPSLRSLVLRRADRLQSRLYCYTDLRSAKVAQLRRQPRMALLAYDPASRLQFRAEGGAIVHAGGRLCDLAWEALAPIARQLYQVTAVPGMPHAGSAPPTDADRASDGRAHFGVLELSLDRIDLLLLGSDGHRRAEYQRAQDWRGHWIAP